MKVLIIIAAVIAFFILLLSIKISVIVHSEDGVTLDAQWLFVKLHLIPKKGHNKKKKKKKKKEKKPKDEKPDETVAEPKKKKPNIFVKFYHNNGLGGFVELLEDLVKALKGMFRRILRAFIIDELFISLLVSAGDAADTAVKFGKTSAAVYPALGFISSNMRVRKQHCEIFPDYVNGQSSTRLHAKISVVPRRLIGAVIIVAFQLLFTVVIKLLKGSRTEKSSPERAEK